MSYIVEQQRTTQKTLKYALEENTVTDISNVKRLFKEVQSNLNTIHTMQVEKWKAEKANIKATNNKKEDGEALVVIPEKPLQLGLSVTVGDYEKDINKAIAQVNKKYLKAMQDDKKKSEQHIDQLANTPEEMGARNGELDLAEY